MAQIVHLTVRHDADRLGVSTDSIDRWTRLGEFPNAVKLGPGSVRWHLSDVKTWVGTRTACFVTSFYGFAEASN